MKKKLTKFWEDNYKSMTGYVRNRINNLSYKDEEDIVQDVMLNLLNKTDFVAPVKNFTGYVYRSLKNQLIDELRKAVREPVSLNSTLNANSSDEFINLITSIEADDDIDPAEFLYEALELLPENQRYVIIENELKGKKLRVIAVELNISLNTLLSRKARGMKNLKRIIETMEENNETV